MFSSFVSEENDHTRKTQLNIIYFVPRASSAVDGATNICFNAEAHETARAGEADGLLKNQRAQFTLADKF